MMEKVVTAQQAKRSARWMDIGTLIAVLIPFPLLIFWFGAAILIYAMTRYHPNPKVGRYIQSATYRFYGVMGCVIPIGTFIPMGNLYYWLIFWAVAALCWVVPSILSLVKIQKDDWQDTYYDLPPSAPSSESAIHNAT